MATFVYSTRNHDIMPHLKTLLVLGLLSISVGTTNAQLTPYASVPGRRDLMHSLEEAGPKLIAYNQNGFSLTDLDLTPYASCVYPTLPTGYYYFTIPEYITSALFDNDPESIEYMIKIHNEDYSRYGTLIARMDGGVLLLDTVHGTAGANGSVDLISFPSIVQTPTGAVLVLIGGTPAQTLLFALPGSLPCIDNCSNGSTGLIGHHRSSATLNIWPNPASGEVQVLTSDLGVSSTTLSVYNALGELAATCSARSPGVFSFSTASLPSGEYQLVVGAGKGEQGLTGRLLVIH